MGYTLADYRESINKISEVYEDESALNQAIEESYSLADKIIKQGGNEGRHVAQDLQDNIWEYTESYLEAEDEGSKKHWLNAIGREAAILLINGITPEPLA